MLSAILVEVENTDYAKTIAPLSGGIVNSVYSIYSLTKSPIAHRKFYDQIGIKAIDVFYENVTDPMIGQK
jgi:hypothetical protein